MLRTCLSSSRTHTFGKYDSIHTHYIPGPTCWRRLYITYDQDPRFTIVSLCAGPVYHRYACTSSKLRLVCIAHYMPGTYLPSWRTHTIKSRDSPLHIHLSVTYPFSLHIRRVKAYDSPLHVQLSGTCLSSLRTHALGLSYLFAYSVSENLSVVIAYAEAQDQRLFVVYLLYRPAYRHRIPICLKPTLRVPNLRVCSLYAIAF